MSADLRRKFIYSLILALLLYVALALWSDWQALAQALLAWPWPWLLAVIGLTLVNYGVRVLRWHWYLQIVGVRISRRDSARIFGVGMLMVMTPGKAGELLKSYMVRNVSGTPMSVTAPVILAERMTDGLAMLMLASAGLFAFPDPKARLIALVVLTSFLVVVGIVQTRPAAEWLLRRAEQIPVVQRFTHHFYLLYESSYILFRPRNLSLALLVGLFVWAIEGVAHAIVLIGFGVPVESSTLLIAVFIFNISTVIGAVFALPGGLGGVEGSMVALSRRLLGMTTATATAAALLTRFCTLWLGVGIGVISFILWPELLAGAESVRRESDVSEQGTGTPDSPDLRQPGGEPQTVKGPH